MSTIGLLRLRRKIFTKENLLRISQTWDLIRSAASLPKVNREKISQMLIDGILVSDPLTIATNLNKFFTTMPSTIVSETIHPSVPPKPDHVIDPTLPSLDFSNNPVTRSKVWDAFKALNFKKSQDINHISMHFLSFFPHS
jgi:hypothetical protein